MKALIQRNLFLHSLAVRAVIILVVGLGFFAVSATSLAQVSSSTSYAITLDQRLGGITRTPTDPIIVAMSNLVAAGNLLGAAQYAIANEPGFYNVVVRGQAAQMPTRTGNLLSNSPTTDYVAGWLGVIYNNMDARNLVNGNFLFTVNPTLAPGVPSNLVNDVLTSNNMYAFLDSNYINSSGANNSVNIASLLQNSGAQQYLNSVGAAQGSAGVAVNNPDPAGLITSRGFAEGNLLAGTNRAMVRNSILEFLCEDISSYADVGPDAPIGRDVDRYPAGSDTTYQTQCVMCHNRLDGMKPAFSLIDMDTNGNYIQHALYNPQPCTTPASRTDYTQAGHNTCQGQFDANNIAIKENRNSQVFPAGFQVTTPAWNNYATSGIYSSMFGWQGATAGSGTAQFGQMLGNSTAFSTCMAQTVFTTVCKRAPASDETAQVQALGANFAGAWQYNLQTLYAQVAILPNCTGSPTSPAQ